MEMNSRNKKDPCGIICILLIYLSVSYSDYVYIKWFIIYSTKLSNLKIIACFIYQVLMVLLIWSHSKATYSDPGIVFKPMHNFDFSSEKEESQEKEEDRLCNQWSVCNKCETYRPPKAHHCRICQRCIRKMDHHCPWINNCVGEMNQKYFLQFLFYVGVVCIYTLFTILGEYAKHEKLPQTKAIHTVVLLIESLLFGIFVTAVITDQLQAIFSSSEPLDKRRNRRITPKSKTRLLSEIFGEAPFFWWFFPCRGTRQRKGDFVV